MKFEYLLCKVEEWVYNFIIIEIFVIQEVDLFLLVRMKEIGMFYYVQCILYKRK